MNDQRTATDIKPGTVVQYRKVGKARVSEVIEVFSDNGARVRLDFITGPASYKADKDSHYWVGVTGPAHVIEW